MSQIYRKIDIRINGDSRFRNLKPLEQWLWFKLMTHHEMTSIGGLFANKEGLAKAFKIRKKEFDLYFSTLIEQHFIVYDEENDLIWFKNFLKYNEPQSPNCVIHWRNALDKLPECALRSLIIQHSAQFIYDNYKQAYREALPEVFREAYAKTSLNQEQEQKHKQDPINNIVTLKGSEKTEKIETHVLLQTSTGDCKIDEDQINYWRRLFPMLDVLDELKQMKKHLQENQNEAVSSIGSYISSWLQRKKNKFVYGKSSGENEHASTIKSSTKRSSAFEQSIELNAEWRGDAIS